jgi:hypothetical protein
MHHADQPRERRGSVGRRLPRPGIQSDTQLGAVQRPQTLGNQPRVVPARLDGDSHAVPVCQLGDHPEHFFRQRPARFVGEAADACGRHRGPELGTQCQHAAQLVYALIGRLAIRQTQAGKLGGKRVQIQAQVAQISRQVSSRAA